jgi:hypothetical protein
VVAYSFKKHFADPICAGTKAQTIRSDRARHARPGEQVQLYTGMRTKNCRLIGRAECVAVNPIRIDFAREVITIGACGKIAGTTNLNRFAVMDGFEDFLAMRDFWRENHDISKPWEGIIIEWRNFAPSQ